MQTYIALFRGINVGGKNILPMKVLVTILEDLGCGNVKTYIQSGNAVFNHETVDTSALAKMIASEIKILRGFEPFILLLEIEHLQKAIAKNPFPVDESESNTLHLGFMASVPANPDLVVLEKYRIESERFQLIDDVYYLHAPEGVGRSKLAANMERLLGVPVTDRNWRTVTKILDMAQDE